MTAAAWLSPRREGEPAFNILGLVLVIYPSSRKEAWKILGGISDDLELMPSLEGLQHLAQGTWVVTPQQQPSSPSLEREINCFLTLEGH